MFKIKVDVKGFEKYTGLLGTVPFTNGVSDREVTEEECNRLGAIMKMSKVEGDEQVGSSAKMIKARQTSATVQPTMKTAEEPKEAPKELKHSKEALEELAETGGIKAVRKVADEYGVKGVQITALIDGILEAQKED